jgi:hypothetical protein
MPSRSVRGRRAKRPHRTWRNENGGIEADGQRGGAQLHTAVATRIRSMARRLRKRSKIRIPANLTTGSKAGQDKAVCSTGTATTPSCRCHVRVTTRSVAHRRTRCSGSRPALSKPPLGRTHTSMPGRRQAVPRGAACRPRVFRSRHDGPKTAAAMPCADAARRIPRLRERPRRRRDARRQRQTVAEHPSPSGTGPTAATHAWARTRGLGVIACSTWVPSRAIRSNYGVTPAGLPCTPVVVLVGEDDDPGGRGRDGHRVSQTCASSPSVEAPEAIPYSGSGTDSGASSTEWRPSTPTGTSPSMVTRRRVRSWSSESSTP